MSAPNPNGGEREFDALRRAQRAHEPSMEEILASIRAIIADDRVAEPARPAPGPKPVAGGGPQIVYSKDAAPALRAVPEVESETASPPTPTPTPPAEPVPWRRPPTEALPPRRAEPEPELQSRREPIQESEPSAMEEPVRWRRPPTEALPLRSAEPEPALQSRREPIAEPEPPMLSDEADRQVSQAFHALSTSLALQSAELVEGMTREILRPMIKSWLDEHLPSLVERLVRAEIQRVARGVR